MNEAQGIDTETVTYIKQSNSLVKDKSKAATGMTGKFLQDIPILIDQSQQSLLKIKVIMKKQVIVKEEAKGWRGPSLVNKTANVHLMTNVLVTGVPKSC